MPDPTIASMSRERDALLSLMLTPGLGHGLIARCLDTFGSASATRDASARELAAIKGISRDRAADIRRALDEDIDAALRAELELIAEQRVEVVLRDDAAYPALLRQTPDPPVLLYVRGRLTDADRLAVAIVGARKCSHYGREQADRFAFQLAESGMTIVSGGAYGIDAAAHRAALRAAGRTIAVIGSGLAKPYPRDHAALFDQIVAEDRGAVVSEFPMTTGPMAENFPRRNRIISGMSLGVLVIEAGFRSGALITARVAVEDHGRECMALPGRVDSPQSEGCHKLLRDGAAALVTRPGDVLDTLGEAGSMLHAAEHPEEAATLAVAHVTLTPAQQTIVAALDSPRTLDQLVAMTQLPVQTVQSELTLLEIRGRVVRRGGLFERGGR
jgi:DNA processing protein